MWGDGAVTGLVYSLDEHESDGSPAKPLPDKPHLRLLADTWANNQKLLVFKSRQMMVSWLMCALILWDCLKPGRRWLVACKKFESANTLLDRMHFIYERLPEALRPVAIRKQGFITVKHKDGDSIIQACAQDSDDPRSQTFSGIWIDEGEFTTNADELHAASMPTVTGGGKFIMTTTPNGRGFFYKLGTDLGRIEF